MGKKKETILVSACLLGTPCRYDGRDNYIHWIDELYDTYDIIPVCPEVLGGLSTPRVPAERRGSLVMTKEGQDVTESFLRGAEKTLQIALSYHVKVALLKAKSPSCGSDEIYDGTFTKTLISGNGVTTDALKAHGITVWNEISWHEKEGTPYNR